MTVIKPMFLLLGLLALAACEKPAHPDAMATDAGDGGAMMDDSDAMSGEDTMMDGS